MTTGARAGVATPAEGWGSLENARSYADFAKSTGWYQRLAADLLRQIDCGMLNRVVDLCAGTGVLTRELLSLVPPSCRIMAIDSSKAMLAQAIRDTQESLVDWCYARAEACALPETGTRFRPGTIDAVFCSAALWETSVPTVLTGVRTMLRPGGRFVFNLGPAAAAAWPMYEKALLASSFAVDCNEMVNYEITVRQADQWSSLPMFAGTAALIRAGDQAGILSAPWMLVAATAVTRS